jgi:hypothetical protein
VDVYESILPRLKNLEKCCCTKILFPEHFYASVDEGVILYKDLRLDGHYMADKAEGEKKPVVEYFLNFRRVLRVSQFFNEFYCDKLIVRLAY